MIATIQNSFHNTSKTVRLKSGRNDIRGRRLRSWKRALCCADCCCSGVSGLRSSDHYAVTLPDGGGAEWEESFDSRTGEEYITIWA